MRNWNKPLVPNPESVGSNPLQAQQQHRPQADGADGASDGRPVPCIVSPAAPRVQVHLRALDTPHHHALALFCCRTALPQHVVRNLLPQPLIPDL